MVPVLIAVLFLAAAALAALVWFAKKRRIALALSLLLITIVTALVAARMVFLPARIAGSAMAPTLRDGERALVNRWAYRTRKPRRGEIAMIHYPKDPSKLFVMRIIAEPGERVQVIGGRVHVNGSVVDDAYVAPEHRGTQDWGPQVIRDGHYFVMGDNRRNSADSRHWGDVPLKYIAGQVQARWWPLSDARTY